VKFIGSIGECDRFGQMYSARITVAPGALITSFTAQPAAVSDGEPVTLHAVFKSGTARVAPIDQAITSATDLTTPATRVSGLPQETVTYTLQVTSGGVTQTVTASVVVTRLPTARDR